MSWLEAHFGGSSGGPPDHRQRALLRRQQDEAVLNEQRGIVHVRSPTPKQELDGLTADAGHSAGCHEIMDASRALQTYGECIYAMYRCQMPA
jgi:hypothetical protein